MIMELLRIKYPRTFGMPKQFFSIDDVRSLVELVETKQYIFHPTAKTITATIDVSDDIKFNEFYGINSLKDKGVVAPSNIQQLK